MRGRNRIVVAVGLVALVIVVIVACRVLLITTTAPSDHRFVHVTPRWPDGSLVTDALVHGMLLPANRALEPVPAELPRQTVCPTLPDGSAPLQLELIKPVFQQPAWSLAAMVALGALARRWGGLSHASRPGLAPLAQLTASCPQAEAARRGVMGAVLSAGGDACYMRLRDIARALMTNPFLYLLQTIVQLITFVVIINAVIGWLYAFDIVGRRNQFVAQIYAVTGRLTEPMIDRLLVALRRVRLFGYRPLSL